MTPEAERQIRLRALAAAAERRNKPTLLIAAAALVFLAAIGFTGFSYASAASARSGLEGSAEDAARILAMAEQMRELEQQDSADALRRKYATDSQLLSKLNRVGPSIGMSNSTLSVRESGGRIPMGGDSPFSARVVSVTMNRVSFDDAMRWINTALEQSDGLFINRVDLNPTPGGWMVSVDLTRWEWNR